MLLDTPVPSRYAPAAFSANLMTCKDFRRRLSGFRDAEAAGDEPEMQLHLAECAPCATRYRALELGVSILRRGAPVPTRRIDPPR